MKAIGPGPYKLVSVLAILATVLTGLFFLILIPIVAPRNPGFAGVLLVAGLSVFGLGIVVTLPLLLFLFLKTPKK